MRTLFIVRHAEAENISTKDLERALTPEGQLQAIRIAAQCKIAGDNIDCIISSTAKRAFQTAAIISDELNLSPILKEEILYKGDVKSFMNIITQLNDSFSTAMIISHNPTLTDLVKHLTGEEVHSMPTASCAIVICPFNEWALIGKHTCMWRQLLLP